ncbi:MAG TPA: ThuA domain-containing protein [Saprospiraceae bacterium]|nr:ThuA domain-containing protein [Saprospiraceae bacterium]
MIKNLSLFNHIACFLLITNIAFAQTKLNVLVFSKTAGYRHESIGASITALTNMSKEKGFDVYFTEESSYFNEQNLKKYKVVIFLNTTGDVLNKEQEHALKDLFKLVVDMSGFMQLLIQNMIGLGIINWQVLIF